MGSLEKIIIGIILGIVFTIIARKKLNKFVYRRRISKAKIAETEAIEILEEKGYQVLHTQARNPIVTRIDGIEHKTHVIADAIVAKGGRRYVVEVKTGNQTENLNASHIRRQLLEYFLIFKPHGIILLDMERKKLHHVELDVVKDQINDDKKIFSDHCKYVITIILTLLVGIVIGALGVKI
ncbi:Holliday junction resolvase-like predicted endonuclease [Desulfitispora alkaliphila]|uniref:hypothetical protein n=1 Tax=Desulfitispora alkaliphila TaxID=622674 RepID=UPI003D244A14